MKTAKTTSTATATAAPAPAPDIRTALAAPFAASDIRHKPAIVKGNRCLALAYIDARAVMDRLDDVVGVDGWQTEYRELPGGSVECRLSVRIGETWIHKSDVGNQSEQSDDGDRMKAAYSDALKRAAVQFGVGRFLYRLPAQWVDFDPVTKRIIGKPAVATTAAPIQAAKPEAKPSNGTKLPADGRELERRIRQYDTRIGAKGQLYAHVLAAGAEAGFGFNMDAWNADEIRAASKFVADFEKQQPAAATA